jgi:hypothetical protein
MRLTWPQENLLYALRSFVIVEFHRHHQLVAVSSGMLYKPAELPLRKLLHNHLCKPQSFGSRDSHHVGTHGEQECCVLLPVIVEGIK